MTRRFFSIAAALLAVLILADFSPAGDNELRTRAELTGKTLASGSAKYREKSRGNTIQQRFEVEVEDAQPGDVFSIHLNGTMIGTIVADGLGRAEMQLRTAVFIDDPGDGNPLPDGFPAVMPGDTITVGGLSGTFDID